MEQLQIKEGTSIIAFITMFQTWEGEGEITVCVVWSVVQILHV